MKLEDVRIIAVIGAGNMGHGIAQAALMNGYEVHLCDVKDEYVQNGVNKIFASLEKFLLKGKISAEIVDGIKNGKLKTFTSIEKAVKDADMISEAVPEIEDLKIKTFQAIDKNAPIESIIATNTSTMSIQNFAESIGRKDKIIGIHYFIPVVMMKLAEVIQCKYTSEETVNLACDYVRKIGKECVFVRKDSPAFVANRIYAPSMVFHNCILDIDGIKPADVDYTIKTKGGLKMGPFELCDYSGIDVSGFCQDYLHEHLSPDYGFQGSFKALVDEGKWGKKTGEGFYKWAVDGSRPVVSESDYTGKYDWEMFFFLEANEATKLFEEGVCSLADCDVAMIYGFNAPAPVAFTRKYNPEYVASKLDAAANRYGKEIFRATDTIRSGKYLMEEIES